MEPLNKIDADRLLTAAQRRPAAQRLALRLLLEYELTAHEICRLEVASARDQQLQVEDKRGRTRSVELSSPAAGELREVLAGRASGPLLADAAGGAQRPEGLRRLLQAAALEAGLDGDVSIHRIHRTADTAA